MSMRVIVLLLVIGVGALGFFAWKGQQTGPPAAAPRGDETSSPPGMTGLPPAEAPDPGIGWDVPQRWVTEDQRPMRLATYSIPAASGDPEDAECAVFHFGPNQGGAVDANIERWIGQFEDVSKPERSTSKVRDLEVFRVKLRGTFLAPSGPMMESQGKKPNYALLGAIVVGPNGSVFFKLTGPEKTVRAAEGDFDKLIKSMHS